MAIFLTIVHVIVCLILILVILLQAGRGQGLSGASFGSGNVQSLLGTKATDFLTKATTVAAICFIFTALGLDYIEIQKSQSLLEGPRGTQSSIDVDALKKALEKVKAEGAEATDNLQNAEEQAQKTSDEVVKAAEDQAQAASNTAMKVAESAPKNS